MEIRTSRNQSSLLESFIYDTINTHVLIDRMVRHHHSISSSFLKVSLYIKFLSLKLITNDYNALKLSPSKEIDTVWHLHILDTNQYEKDCIAICGRIINHNPDGDLHGREERFSLTKKLFKKYFNDNI